MHNVAFLVTGGDGNEGQMGVLNRKLDGLEKQRAADKAISDRRFKKVFSNQKRIYRRAGRGLRAIRSLHGWLCKDNRYARLGTWTVAALGSLIGAVWSVMGLGILHPRMAQLLHLLHGR